jgi:hypothetical protein
MIPEVSSGLWSHCDAKFDDIWAPIGNRAFRLQVLSPRFYIKKACMWNECDGAFCCAGVRRDASGIHSSMQNLKNTSRDLSYAEFCLLLFSAILLLEGGTSHKTLAMT